MEIKAVHEIAFKDITAHVKELCKKDPYHTMRYFVTPQNSLYNKEVRRLNKELGISSVNHLGNKNQSKNK